jgi:fibronectin type 3 domain-containing protein
MLNWTASTSTVSGYNVYRSTPSGRFARINTMALVGVSYVDSDVRSGTTYHYVATAVDSNGNESAYSNQVAAQIP